MFCSSLDTCENDCYDKYYNSAYKNKFKEQKKLDLLSQLYLKYKTDSPSNTLDSWEVLLKNVGGLAVISWQDVKLHHNI